MSPPHAPLTPLFAPAVGLLLAVALTPQLEAQEIQRYTLSGERVAIYNLVGRIEVEAAPKGDLVVEVTPRGADAGKLRVETGPLGGRSTLRVIYPDDRIIYPPLGRNSNSQFSARDDGTFGGDEHGGHKVTVKGNGTGLEAYADLRILVPAGRQVSVNLGVGAAKLSNVNGDLDVSTASGDVTADEVKGTIRIDTGSGDVAVSGATGDLFVDTGSGDVRLTGVAGGRVRIETGSGNVTGSTIAGPELRVETGSGDVELREVQAPDAYLETGSGNVKANLLGDLKSLSINTGSGDVSATVPVKFSGTIRIETGSGDDIDIGFPVQLTRKSDSGLRARVGEGDGTIDIETGSGGVTLER